ncbi:MAG: TlpA disulfide reductase family protein [Planctomycetales bacterium]|jgi:thiol-disulfide isomerase/thioredoxin|nr:TlpA disulfide reductase family protein [Planctomycetales bacterium]
MKRYVLAAAAFCLSITLISSFKSAEILHADEKAAQTDDAKITLTAGTWDNVLEQVKANKGRIVVVDIWSTSCLPCMTEFPNLVELQKTHGNKIACISFNVDYVGIKSKPAEFYRARVEAFLTKQKATFSNVLCNVESDKVFEKLELSSIPAVYVFDAEGKEVRRFDDSLLEDGEEEAFTYKADINPFIKGLVDQLGQAGK